MSTKPPAKAPNLVSVTTINRDGSRFILHPSDVRGRWVLLRRASAVLLLAIYVLLPWIPINGHPAVFFDVASGRFHLFGLTFITQDLWLLFFLLSGFGFGLIYVTSLFGRVWCGWACPYTVFLEHVFRRIERLIDGDGPQRRKLAAQPMNPAKFARGLLKHALYFLCATFIAHLFLSYFISLPKLYAYMQGSPADHFKAFGVVAFLSVALYGCFAWFREQFCIVLCPYGRIQSALSDDDTVTVGYDEGRGEPRGKKNDPGTGDCIDCRRCVQVCPTGIDIRNGLQLECIACTACIDACDEIMTKIQRPKGLIRYGSLNALSGKKHRWLRPRTLVYTVLMLVGAGVLTLNLSRLAPVFVSVTRMEGSPYFQTEDTLRNQFNLQCITKLNEETRFTVDLPGLPEGVRWTAGGAEIVAPEQGEITVPLVVTVDKERWMGEFEMEIVIHAEPSGTTIKREVQFLGPDPRLMRMRGSAAAPAAARGSAGPGGGHQAGWEPEAAVTVAAGSGRGLDDVPVPVKRYHPVHPASLLRSDGGQAAVKSVAAASQKGGIL